MTFRYTLYHTSFDRFHCDLFGAPMTHWIPAGRRVFTGDGYDLCHLLCAKFSYSTEQQAVKIKVYHSYNFVLQGEVITARTNEMGFSPNNAC